MPRSAAKKVKKKKIQNNTTHTAEDHTYMYESIKTDLQGDDKHQARKVVIYGRQQVVLHLN